MAEQDGLRHHSAGLVVRALSLWGPLRIGHFHGELMSGIVRAVVVSLVLAIGWWKCAEAADPLLDAEAKASGFLLGQQLSLERIAELYPDLKFEAEAARADFASRFGHAYDNIMKAISDAFGPSAEKTYREKVEEALATGNAAQVSRPEAEAFIAFVHERAKGNIEEPFRRAIIAYEYRDSPAQEFSDGYRQTYSVKGHAKSNGMDFQIDVPASWAVYEAERPHVVQNFKTLTREPYATYNITVFDLDADPSIAAMPADQPIPLTLDDLAAMVPETATLISSKLTTLENRPAGILVYDWPQDRMGTKMETRAHIVVTTSAHSLIVLTGMASGLNAATRDSNWILFEPLFAMIGNSFVDKLAYQ